MNEISGFRMLGLRAMYLLIAAGLSLSMGREVVSSVGNTADAYTVINAFLLALVVLSVAGLLSPLKFLPILLFEIIWKSAWLLLYALPLAITVGLDEYGASTAFACILGVVLTPMVVPWRYVAQQYFYFYSKSNSSPTTN